MDNFDPYEHGSLNSVPASSAIPRRMAWALAGVLVLDVLLMIVPALIGVAGLAT